MTSASVADLVRGAAAGDQDAWDALVARYEGMVWAIIRSFRLSSGDAADVFQTTWLRLVEHLGGLREPAAVGSWLAITAKRECWRLSRRAARTVPTHDDDLQMVEDDRTPAPDTSVLVDERDRVLWSSLDVLRDRCRELVRLLLADPVPGYDEISAALDIPVGSIGPTRRRCLEQLRAHLAERGITADSLASG